MIILRATKPVLPIAKIIEYLKEKLAVYLEIGVPFFPPSPNTIDDLTQTFVNINNQMVATVADVPFFGSNSEA
jgi:hypothetical protein